MKTIRGTIQSASARRGFTILEVVVAMIIISILTLVMMPTVTNRANSARLNAAEHDLNALAEAESRASIDMNYYVVPWRLNNVIGSGSKGTRGTPIGGYTNPNNMFIDISTLDIPGNVTELYDSFDDNETNFGWGGPYLNYRNDENGNNWPDDPWGNDYLLFTKAGGLFPPNPDVNDSEFVTTGPGFVQNDGTANPGIANLQEVFDRPAWISLGPNKLPGDGSGVAATPNDPGFYGQGDDLLVYFEGLDGPALP